MKAYLMNHHEIVIRYNLLRRLRPLLPAYKAYFYITGRLAVHHL